MGSFWNQEGQRALLGGKLGDKGQIGPLGMPGVSGDLLRVLLALALSWGIFWLYLGPGDLQGLFEI